MPAPRILMLEFNELCPTLLERWIAAGDLPNFARLRAQSDVFTTFADTDEAERLEPWIQWVSVHTGLAHDQHGVFHLTDGARATHDDIWRLLITSGRRVGSGASMNVAPFAAPGSFFLGDPWTANGDASPPELNVYNRFVGHQVREYSNSGAALSVKDYVAFLAFMLRHGLDADTMTAIVMQLASERLSDRRLAYRRAILLDQLQYCVFKTLWNRYRPDFATFFLNSTAHLQHSYWRHMDPSAFKHQPDDGELAVYGDAIRFGYQQMDRLIGKFLRLAEATSARIVFMTALSQQPFTRLEDIGGQHFHRLHDVQAFLNRLGVTPLTASPVMTHQYMLRFKSDGEAVAARSRIAALSLEGGRSLFDFAAPSTSDGSSLYFGCHIATATPADAAVSDALGGALLRFGDLLYRIDATKSGCHHPEGALWITGSDAVGRVHANPVSILDVLPTLLHWYGLKIPEQLSGRPLPLPRAG